MFGLLLLVSCVVALLVLCAADPDAAGRGLAGGVKALGQWPLWAVVKIRDGCHQLVLRMLDHGSGEADASTLLTLAPTDSGSWIGMTLLCRLLLLALVVAIVLGTLSLDFLRGPLVALGVAAFVPLLPPAVAIGLLYTALPAYFGALLLDYWGLTPRNVHVFARLDSRPEVKTIVGWALKIAVVLSLLMGLCVFVDSWLLLQQLHSLVLEGLLNAIVGLLAIAACLSLGWSGGVGLTALLALPVMLLWLVCAGLALVLQPLHEASDLFAQHVAPGLGRVLAMPGQVLWRVASRLPLVGTALRPSPLPGPTGTPRPTYSEETEETWEEPRQGLAVVRLPGADRPAPAPLRPATLRHKASALFVDDTGRRIMWPFLRDVGLLGGKDGLDVAGYCGLRRNADYPIKTALARLGGRDASTTGQEMARARERARTSEEVEALLLQAFCEKAAALMPVKTTDDPLLVFVGLQWIQPIVPALRYLHVHLRRQSIVPVVESSAADLAEPQGSEAVALLRQLASDQIIASCVFFDGQTSPLVRAVGRQRQLELVARTLAALLLEHRHAEENHTAAEDLLWLSRGGTFVTLAIRSAALLPGERPSALSLARLATRDEPVGSGDAEQTRGRLEDLVARVRRDPTCQTLALPDGVPVSRSVLVALWPDPLRGSAFRQVAAGLEQVVAEVLPGGRAVFVSGNGCADDGVGGHRFFCQVGILQAMTELVADAAPAAHVEGSLLTATTTSTTDPEVVAASQPAPESTFESTREPAPPLAADVDGPSRRIGRRGRSQTRSQAHPIDWPYVDSRLMDQ